MPRSHPAGKWLAALAGLMGLAGPAPAQIAPAYTVSGLTGSTGPSQALAISPNGAFVTGFTTVGGAQQAFRYNFSTGTLTPLGVLSGTTNSVGIAVNDAGAVAGYSTGASLTNNPNFAASDRAFLATANTPTAIGILSGNGFSGQPFNANRATGINATNQVVGTAFNLNTGDFQGYRSAGGGAPTALNLLGPSGTLGAGTLALANGINASGQVAGEADRDTGSATPNPYFAVRYPAASATPADLPLPSGFSSAHGFAINNAGNVGGYAENLNSSGLPTGFRGYFSNGTTATALGVLTGGTQSFVNAINNNDVLVGDADAAPGNRAVVFSGTTPIDLNTRLTGANAGNWTLQAAWGISDSGFIVGYGLLGGIQQAFVLTPVPEPGTFVLSGVGLAALVGLRRRRKRAAV